MNDSTLSPSEDNSTKTGDVVVEGAKEEKIDWISLAIEREATPSTKRQETVEEFAKRIGIDPSTYYYQMRKKENKRKVVEIWLNEALVGGNEVLEALREKAKAGDTKAIELYMKFVLELAENLDIKSGGQSITINQVFYDRDNNSIQIRTTPVPANIPTGNTEPKV